jgi:hypothetical protein
LVVGFPEYAAQARSLAERLGAPCAIADLHRFPDGESKVTLPAPEPGRLRNVPPRREGSERVAILRDAPHLTDAAP